MKIVIADDEPLARGRLRDLLAQLSGVQVVAEASDGRAHLRSGHPVHRVPTEERSRPCPLSR